MTNEKTSASIGETFPLEKSDIQYNPVSGEISLKRETFDAFVKYAQELVEKLETAEDARDVALYRARKAGKTADVLHGLTESVLQATEAVRNWLSSPEHTIRELSERTGIPYATCYRIVNERLGSPELVIGHLEKLIAAVSRDQRPFGAETSAQPRFKRVLFGLSKESAEAQLVSPWQSKGSEVAAIHAGPELAQKAREVRPDLIVVDVSMSNLKKNSLEQLQELAKDQMATVVLTGQMDVANSALLQGSFEGLARASEGG